MGGGDFRVEGLPEYKAALKAMPAGQKRGAFRGMRYGAVRVQRHARRIVPVDTGRLRASIAYTIRALATMVRGIVGTIVKYAGFVERGTKHQKAQPYLEPALEAEVGNIKIDIVREIQKEYDLLAKG